MSEPIQISLENTSFYNLTSSKNERWICFCQPSVCLSCSRFYETSFKFQKHENWKKSSIFIWNLACRAPIIPVLFCILHKIVSKILIDAKAEGDEHPLSGVVAKTMKV